MHICWPRDAHIGGSRDTHIVESRDAHKVKINQMEGASGIEKHGYISGVCIGRTYYMSVMSAYLRVT